MNKLTLLIFFAILSTQAFAFSSYVQTNELKFKELRQTETLSDLRKKQLAHLVKQDCGSCHGMTLKGGLGPALLPENVKDKPLLLLQNTILYGRPGTAMPPWKNILTEQEVLWISQSLQQGTYLRKTNNSITRQKSTDQQIQGKYHEK